MRLWLDAQLPPQLAPWLTAQFGAQLGVEAIALRDLGLRDASDREIFAAARAANAVLVSKDSDFVDLVQQRGTPPALLWVTCGNVTNARLQAVFLRTMPRAIELLREGRPVVEIADAQ